MRSPLGLNDQAMWMLVSSVLILIVSIDALPSSSQFSSSFLTPKRGFKAGAADRFAHGFGKRATDEIDQGDDSNTMPEINLFRNVASNELFARAINSNYDLALEFVRNRLDADHDGYISLKELLKANK